MKFKIPIITICCLFSVLCLRAQVLESGPTNNNIKTLRAYIDGQDEYTLPIINLNGGEMLKFSFDELFTDIKNYSYTIIPCNADWTPASLSTLEWGNGFATNNITQVDQSRNTTVPYFHYSFTLPNSDLQFKLSGNYVAVIHETDDESKIIGRLRFCVAEQLVSIGATIKGNTDIDINNKMQQLDFKIVGGTFKIDDPSYLKVFVRQNDRSDNAADNLSPTYISGNKYTYTNNRDLIFEGGDEYNTIDFSSIYSYGEGIERIKFYDPYYHVELTPYAIEQKDYQYIKDVDGGYKIHVQEYEDDSTSADYFLVHFSVPAKSPFFDGELYVLGAFNNNKLDQSSRMIYSAEHSAYEKDIMLKQGGYNYQYAFLPKGTKKASLDKIKRSHWQTENTYAVYVYYRPFGARYDRLIAVRTMQNK